MSIASVVAPVTPAHASLLLAAALAASAIVAAVLKLFGGYRVRLSWPAAILSALVGTTLGATVGTWWATALVDDWILALVVAAAVVAVVSAVNSRLHAPTRAVTVAALVSGGENSRVEFKSTARVNLQLRRRDARIEHAVLKTVAAFANSGGGILLIGVSDVGRALGLEPDLTVIRGHSIDGWELWLRDTMTNAWGASFTSRIAVTFPTLTGHTIAVVTVPPAPRPVYLVDKDRQHFFIRSGNSTVSLPVADAVAYLTWNKRLPVSTTPRPVLTPSPAAGPRRITRLVGGRRTRT